MRDLSKVDSNHAAMVDHLVPQRMMAGFGMMQGVSSIRGAIFATCCTAVLTALSLKKHIAIEEARAMLIFLACLLRQTYPDEEGDDIEDRHSGEGRDNGEQYGDDDSDGEEYTDYELPAEGSAWSVFSFGGDKTKRKVQTLRDPLGTLSLVLSHTRVLCREATLGVAPSCAYRRIASRSLARWWPLHPRSAPTSPTIVENSFLPLRNWSAFGLGVKQCGSRSPSLSGVSLPTTRIRISACSRVVL
jgi:hypothetical protein